MADQVIARADDHVILLDTSDRLRPSAEEQVRRAFARDPRVVHVQWPLLHRGADGAERIWPDGLLSTGDLVPRLRSGGVEACVFAPRSGHAFRRHFLDEARALVAPDDDEPFLTLALMSAAAGRTAALYEPQVIGAPAERPEDDLFERADRDARRLDDRLSVVAAFWERRATPLPVAHLRALSTPHRLTRLLAQVEAALPPGAPYALVDEELWRPSLRARGHAAHAFPDHDGDYWGPPADDTEARAALEAAAKDGIRQLVVGWPCFWWFDVYPEWAALLRSGRTLAQSGECVIFGLDAVVVPAWAPPRRPVVDLTPLEPPPGFDLSAAVTGGEALIAARGEAYVAQIRQLVPAGTPCALLDFPDHTNVGDSAIWLGERIALHAAGLEPSYFCSLDDYEPEALRRAVGDGVVFLHGGGNLGDLYPAHQYFRERVVRDLPGNQVVQLPETVNFRRRASVERARRALDGHGGFTLLVRDRLSLEVAESLFERPPLLCPDAAFVLGPLPPPVDARLPLRWLARSDFESGAGVSGAAGIDTVDWLQDDDSTPRGWWTPAEAGVALTPWDESALRHVHRGSRLLAEARVVITDRLHGHVLSLLLRRPHVLLNDAFGKVREFHDAWTADCDLVQLAESPDEAVLLARQLLGAV